MKYFYPGLLILHLALAAPHALADAPQVCGGDPVSFLAAGSSGQGFGIGKTQATAIAAAAEDAVEKDIKGQFECEDCPDGEPCAKKVENVDAEGSNMQDPTNDCQKTVTSGTGTIWWSCNGMVNIEPDEDGNQPSGDGRCDDCGGMGCGSGGGSGGGGGGFGICLDEELDELGFELESR